MGDYERKQLRAALAVLSGRCSPSSVSDELGYDPYRERPPDEWVLLKAEEVLFEWLTKREGSE